MEEEFIIYKLLEITIIIIFIFYSISFKIDLLNTKFDDNYFDAHFDGVLGFWGFE